MEDLKNIIKIVGCLVGGLLFFYFYFFILPSRNEDIDKDVLDNCLPLQYNFKVMSFYSDRYYNFEGRTKEGRVVRYKLPRNWSLENVCTEGDSIHKLAGEKELYLIKTDTVIKLPLKVHGEGI